MGGLDSHSSIMRSLYRETQSRDLTTARSQIMEFEAEVERVKRQLTNERFERCVLLYSDTFIISNII